MLALFRSPGEEFTLGQPTLYTIRVEGLNPRMNSVLLRITPANCNPRLVKLTLQRPVSVGDDLAEIQLKRVNARHCHIGVDAPEVLIDRPDYQGPYQCRSKH